MPGLLGRGLEEVRSQPGIRVHGLQPISMGIWDREDYSRNSRFLVPAGEVRGCREEKAGSDLLTHTGVARAPSPAKRLAAENSSAGGAGDWNRHIFVVSGSQIRSDYSGTLAKVKGSGRGRPLHTYKQ